MHDTPPLRAGILGRVSKAILGEDRSVTEQQEDNRRACAEHGWKIPQGAEYQDVGSASRFARKERQDWPRLLGDVVAGQLDVVVLWEPSRGSREPEEWLAFLSLCRARNVLLHITIHRRTYDIRVARDWRSLAEDGIDSAYEVEKTRERVLRTIAASAEAGKPHGSVPYGYERVYDERTRRLVEQRPVYPQAAVVVEIFLRVAGAEPVSAVIADLNSRGIPGPSGKPWSRSTVRRIVRSPAYLGKRYVGGQRGGSGKLSGGRMVDAVWPSLVSAEIWYAAQRVLDDPARKLTRPGRYKHLLSYMATCGECGASLNAGRDKRTGTPFYTCSNPQHHCARMAEAVLDAYVTEAVLARAQRGDIYEHLVEGSDEGAAAARAEAAQLRQRLDEAADAYAAGKLPLERLTRIEVTLTDEIMRAEKRAAALAVPVPVRALAEPGADVAARWKAMPVAARREVVKILAGRVVLCRSIKDGHRLAPHDRIKLPDWES